MVKFNELSRYAETQPIIVNGSETLGKWKPPGFLVTEPAESDIYALVVDNTVEGRPDLIANDIYGASELAWVLIAFNKVKNPLNWPRAGQTIKYPDRSIVFTELLG